jgi:hypothetical protein
VSLTTIVFPDESEVHLKTSPPTPLLAKERGDKAQLYGGEVIAVAQFIGKRYINN